MGTGVKLFTVTLYKLKMMLNDRLFFAAMVIIPLLITIATGYALRYEKLNKIPAAVVDEDGSDYSKTLLERLMNKESLEVTVTARDEALKMLKNNKVETVFIIKNGFEEKIIKMENKGIIDLIKSPSSFSSGYVSEVVAGEVIRFTADNIAADWVKKRYAGLHIPVTDALTAEIIQYADSQWEPEPLMTVNYREMEGNGIKDDKKILMPAAAATSAGVVTVFIMFYILFSSGWLIEERRNGTLKRLVSGPDALGLSFAGNVLALAAAGAFQIVLFALTDKLIFGVNLFPDERSYILFGAYLVSVISISLFLSSVLKTPAQLQAGAPVFALLTGFAGGCFWNFVEVPERIRRLSMLTPQGWVLSGINDLLLKPGGAVMILLPAAVLLSISLILLPLSYIIIKVQVNR